MSDSGILPSKEELQASNDDFITAESDNDFVQLLPPELCNKLFYYLPDNDIFSCSKCSISWQRVINNNSQWKIRCIRKGWATRKSRKEDAQKWNSIKTHVSQSQMEYYKFRTSPIFLLPPLASLRISELCDWAIYFRQCLHLERNWSQGIYTIVRLPEPEDNDLALNNYSDSDGRLLVTGTSKGKVYIWSVEGVPKFLACIYFRRRVEVETVKLVGKYLIVLYQTGTIKVFNTENILLPVNSGKANIELAYEMHGIGDHSVELQEFLITAEPIDEGVNQSDFLVDEDGEEDSIEYWIRDMFRVDFWMGNDLVASDMLIYANSSWVVLTGLLCKYFIIWDIHSGRKRRQIPLKPDFQVIYESYMSAGKLYLSARKRQWINNGIARLSSHILIYDLLSLENEDTSMINVTEIPSESIVEEIRSNAKDELVAFSTQDGTVCGISLLHSVNTDGYEVLFEIHAASFVDNLMVSDSLVVYHLYDGLLVGLNWYGQQLYEISAHTGLVKGLKIFENVLVSAGEAMQLSVWNNKTGEKLHTVHHQPCRIQSLFIDATKIITVGREDAPVVVAYW